MKEFSEYLLSLGKGKHMNMKTNIIKSVYPDILKNSSIAQTYLSADSVLGAKRGIYSFNF